MILVTLSERVPNIYSRLCNRHSNQIFLLNGKKDLPFALPHQKKIGAKWNKAGPTTPTHTSVNGGHAKLSSSDDVYEPPRKRRKREEPNPLATFSSEYAHSVGTSTSRAAVTRIPSTFTHSDNLAIKSYDSKGEYPTSPSDTSSSTSTAYFPDQPSRSLPEICNFDEFVEHLDKVCNDYTSKQESNILLT